MVPRGYTRSLRDWAILGFAPSPPTPLPRVRGRGECERNAFQMQGCRGFHQPTPDPSPRSTGARGEQSPPLDQSEYAGLVRAGISWEKKFDELV